MKTFLYFMWVPHAGAHYGIIRAESAERARVLLGERVTGEADLPEGVYQVLFHEVIFPEGEAVLPDYDSMKGESWELSLLPYDDNEQLN